ncbi:hypothetical protein D3C76_1563800 [compost metagenome]
MIAVWVQRDGFAGRQCHERHRLHAHHIVLHGRLVDLHCLGHRRRDTQQLAVVACGDGHKSAARLLSRDGGANPGVVNLGLGRNLASQPQQGQPEQGVFDALGDAGFIGR